MSKIFSDYITSSPKIFLSVFFLALIFSISNLDNFKLDASSDSLVLESDDDLKYYREVSTDYSSSDFLIIIFVAMEVFFADQTISNV